MPSFTIYTESDRPGTAELPPYVIGDPTTWNIRFEKADGTNYVPANVTVKTGYISGLADGTYASAFKWSDRTGIESTASVTVTSGVPTLSFSPTPANGVVGTDGVYVVRGNVPNGIISGFTVANDTVSLPYGQTLAPTSSVLFYVNGVNVAQGRVTWIDAPYDINPKIINGGTGYPDTITPVFTGGGGTGMTGTVSVTPCGTINTVKITSTGCGYTSAPTLSFANAGTGSGADVILEYVRNGNTGGLSSVAVVNPGSGYTSAPTVTLSGGGGTGAEISLLGYDTVSQLNITNNGSGYTGNPTVVIDPPSSGVQATATASGLGTVTVVTYTGSAVPSTITQDFTETLTSGNAAIEVLWQKLPGTTGFRPSRIDIPTPGSGFSSNPTITARGFTFTLITNRLTLKITNPGSGYTSAPGVTFSGGNGTNLAATAVIGRITGATLVNPGSGYTSIPSYAISGGVGSGCTIRLTTAQGANLYRPGAATMTTTNVVPITGTPYVVFDAPYYIKGSDGNVTSSTLDLRSMITSITAGVEKSTLPFKRAESSTAILGAVRLSGYSDGRINAETGQTQFDHSALVVLPRTIASANFTASTDSEGIVIATGTLNPVNAHVTARLAVRRSVVQDIQVFGDGRMLFQGALAVVNKIV